MLRHYPDEARIDEIPPQSRRAAAIQYHEVVGNVLYALRFKDGTIKLGCTGRIDSRLAHFYHIDGCTPEVLAIKPGSFEDEQAVHGLLVDHLDHGREWYRPDPEVWAVINGWRTDVGMEPLPIT